MKRYENLEDALCKELEMLDKKYGGDTAEMTVQDVEKADKLYHALKSAETYYAMAEAGMDEDKESGEGRSYRGRSYGSYGRSYGGRSYARRRDMMGRFSGGYDDGYSGHYPPMMPYGRDGWQY